MTNMTHRTVDARRAHNRRRKGLIDFVRTTFGCTAKEGIARIRAVMEENISLRQKNETLREKMKNMVEIKQG